MACTQKSNEMIENQTKKKTRKKCAFWHGPHIIYCYVRTVSCATLEKDKFVHFFSLDETSVEWPLNEVYYIGYVYNLCIVLFQIHAWNKMTRHNQTARALSHSLFLDMYVYYKTNKNERNISQSDSDFFFVHLILLYTVVWCMYVLQAVV